MAEKRAIYYFVTADPPFWFALWWLFWIVSNIADRISFRMSFREGVSIDSLVVTSVIADALNVISAIFAIIVVSDIDRRQTEASKSLALELPLVPPPPAQFRPQPATGGDYFELTQSVLRQSYAERG